MLLRRTRFLRHVQPPTPLTPAKPLKPVTFGKAKRAAGAREAEAQKHDQGRVAERRAQSVGAIEDESWRKVSTDFGFMLKPPHHTWTTFLDELTRYDLQISQLALDRYHVRCRWVDLRPPPGASLDAGSDVATLFDLTGDQQRLSQPVIQLFDAALDVLRTSRPLHAVPFYSADNHTHLELRAYLHKSCPVEAPIQHTNLAKRSDTHFDASIVNKGGPPPAGPNCAVTVADPAPPAASPTNAVGMLRDQTPWVCVAGRVSDFTSHDDPWLFDISAPTFASLVLRAIVTMLHAEVIPGVKGYEEVGRLQIESDLVPRWNELRARAKMHAMTFPVDMRLLPERRPNFHSQR